MVAGLALATVAALRALGWLDWDWNAIDAQIRSALTWSRGQAEAWKALIEGWLPSTAVTAVGLWRGFRHTAAAGDGTHGLSSGPPASSVGA